MYNYICIHIYVCMYIVRTQYICTLLIEILNCNWIFDFNSFSIWFKNKYTFFFFLWLCWVFVSVQGLSLVAASGGHSSSWCTGLSLSRPLLLRSTGSRRTGSVVVAHGPSCPAACGIFPDQGSNPCPLHWQAASQPLRHQGSPKNKYTFNVRLRLMFLLWPLPGTVLPRGGLLHVLPWVSAFPT